MTTPTIATSMTSSRLVRNTNPPVAPTLLRVARSLRLRSTKPRTALATPTPPTTRAVRPTRVRNWVKRCRFLSNWGETLERVRISQPASGRAFRACATVSFTFASLAGWPVASGRRVRRLIQRTSEPGWIRPVLRSASTEMITRGPKPTPLASLSGSDFSSARYSKVPSPIRMRSPIRRSSLAARAASATKPGRPLRAESASCKGMTGATSASPMEGYEAGTALISTSAAVPSGLRAMTRRAATVERVPRSSRNWRSASFNSRWMRAKETSPPRIRPLSRARPSERLRETEPTPTMAVTPSAMQARKI